MASNDNKWVHTQAALKNFMANFKCNKCKTLALEPRRYQKCGHLFCKVCIRLKQRCPTCNTPAKRTEIHPDIITPQLITYGNTIALIIKASHSPPLRDDKGQKGNVTVQDDSLLTTPKIRKDINKPNLKGETPLHRACLKRDMDAVRTLLDAGANPNTRDHSNWPPLHEVSSFGYFEITKVLLEAGAAPNIPGNHNRTALHEAVIFGDIETIKIILQYNADLNARDSDGKTPIDYAKTEEMRKILTEYKPMESILEKTMTNISMITNVSNNNFTGSSTHILGLKLSNDSISLLTQVANKHKIKIAKTFTQSVTHIVVEVNNQDVTPASFEILLAILHGKWILTNQWIRYCMSLADLSIMELEAFEVQGTTSAPRSNTPTRARENEQKQNPRLFNNCNFFFVMNKQSTYLLGELEFTKAKLSKLITEGGGKILTREPNPEVVQTYSEIPFHVSRDLTHPLHRCSHYIIYPPGQDEPMIKYNMPHIKSLPLLWLIECIEQFQLLDPAHIGIIE